MPRSQASRVRRLGNSHGMIIPRALQRAAGWRDNEALTVVPLGVGLFAFPSRLSDDEADNLVADAAVRERRPRKRLR